MKVKNFRVLKNNQYRVKKNICNDLEFAKAGRNVPKMIENVKTRKSMPAKVPALRGSEWVRG